MLTIEGGQTTIGTKPDEIKALTERTESLLRVTVLETPQHKQRVETFHLMVSEVTNEQYMAFVKAAGYAPPEHWGKEAIDEALRAYLEEVGKQREEARKAGRPFENQTFDRQDWWKKNWQGKPFRIPPGNESLPVVYVSYRDAMAYCAWAGLRLPTEFEYQRAVRQNTDRRYPWGDEWDPSMAAGVSGKAPSPVGSYPGGAVGGVFDLSGNVWEWTASAVEAYPGYKDLRFEVGPPNRKQKLDGIATFNANQRVVVGGCYQTSEITCRATTRRPADPWQTADSMGFRCASTPAPGVDAANTVLTNVYPRADWPEHSKFDATKCAGMDRWKSSAGSAKVAGQAGKPAAAMPGYAVVEAHDYVVLAPAVDIETITVKGLGEIDRTTKIAHLGVYSSSIDAVDPKLPKGTYLVSYRAAGRLVEAASPAPGEEAGKAEGEKKPADGGKQSRSAARFDAFVAQDTPPKPAPPAPAPPTPPAPAPTPAPAQGGAAVATPPVEPALAPAIVFPEGMDLDQPNLIFSALDGTPLTFIASPSLEMLKPAQPTMAWTQANHKYYEVGASGKPELRNMDVEVLTIQVFAWCKVSNKSVGMRVPIKFEKGALDGDWRK